MSINFSCSCGQEIAVSDAHAGKQCRCKKCGAILTIPILATIGEPEPSRTLSLPPETPVSIVTASVEPPAAKPPAIATEEAAAPPPVPSRRNKWILVTAILLGAIAAAGTVVYIWFPQWIPGRGEGCIAVIGIENASFYENVEMEGLNWSLPQAGAKVRVLSADEDALQVLLLDTRLAVPKGDGKGPFWVKRFALCSPEEYQRRVSNKTVPKSVVCLCRKGENHYLYGGSIGIRNNEPALEPGQAVWLDRSMEGQTFTLAGQRIEGELDTLFCCAEDEKLYPLNTRLDRSNIKIYVRPPVVEPTTYAGTWRGQSEGEGSLQLQSLFIEKDEFPCAGNNVMTIPSAPGLVMTGTLTWHKKDGHLVGMCLKNGKETAIVTAKMENGRLAGEYEGKPFSGFRKLKH